MAMDIVVMGQRTLLDSEGESGFKSDVPRKKFGCHGHIMLKMVDIVKAEKGGRRYH
ncbi:hypothetical protein D3C72_1787660 [compost metagenome]